MRKFQPSLVDWDEIKERVLAGEGYTSVAKDYEVSRQAIQKRCNKEEWIANKPRSMAVKRELYKRNQKAQPIATAQPVAVAVAQPAQPMLLREDKRAAIIQLLADGVPKTHAAAALACYSFVIDSPCRCYVNNLWLTITHDVDLYG